VTLAKIILEKMFQSSIAKVNADFAHFVTLPLMPWSIIVDTARTELKNVLKLVLKARNCADLVLMLVLRNLKK